MKIGKDSVVIGNVPANLEVGEGCVIIGATDNNGNCIINQPMAVGRNARAGHNSIAIGANAGAGCDFDIIAALQHLSKIAETSNDQKVLQELTRVISEFSKTKPNKSLILESWEVVKAAASLNGAHALLTKITLVLHATFA